MVRRRSLGDRRGQDVTKNKKKKKSAGGTAGKAAKKLKALTDNRVVADVIAAALVATASALKDSNKAQRLAASAGDELEKLSKKSAQRGNAMWQLALDIGRRALDEIVGDSTTRKSPKPAKSPKASKAPKARNAAKPRKKAARKSTAKTSRAKAN
jgi:hypothetical protein